MCVLTDYVEPVLNLNPGILYINVNNQRCQHKRTKKRDRADLKA